MGRSTKNFVALLRIPTYLLLITYLLVGYVVGVSTQVSVSFGTFSLHHALGIGAAALVLGLWYINGTSLNDFADFEIDKINLKGDTSRPLVLGTINRPAILRVAVVTGIVTIAVSAAWGAPGIAATVLVLLLNLAYSLKPIQISHRGAWAPLLLPIAYVLYPVTLGLLLVDARITAHVILLVGLLYLHFFSRILLKDFRDVVGDKKFGKRTLALSIGTKRTTQIALGSLLTSTAGLAMLTRDVSPVSILPLVFLGGIGASLLLRLAETTKWTEQKPLILGFGRTASGVLLVICLAYGFGISPATTAKQTLAYAITAYLVTTSAYDLMRHNA